MGLLGRFLEGAPAPTRMLLTRAGPVENPGVLYSHPGLPLSEEGRRAVLALLPALREAGVRAVYAADSLAEAEAGRTLAEALNLPFETYPALRERSWGAWEGLPFEEVRRRWPKEVAAWARDEAGFAPPGGESVRAVFARSQPVLRELLSRHRGEAFLVVGTCTVNRAALALALPFLLPEEGLRIEQDYAKLTELRFYGEDGVLGYANR